LDGDRLVLRGIIVKPDGSDAHEVMRHGVPDDAARLGTEAGRELAARGGAGFFAVA
jgi:hydroxymethylbilane synthase